MCTNCKYITNKYTHKRILVKCGKCPACIQERAAKRATRIRNHARNGYSFLFVTLTYSPDYLPFVYRDDLRVTDGYINIYRNADVRCYRNKIIKDSGIRPIDSVFLSDDALLSSYGVKKPNGSPDGVVGVIYYKDLQNFFKRLRINLKRNYNYESKITAYSCAEYGSTSHRPHFHLLIQCKTTDVETVQSAIVESWKYADRTRTEKYIEIAKDAASYCASYVNSGNTLPEILTSRSFRQKHSYSKGFGLGLECFTLSSLLDMYRKRDFSYNVTTFEQGIPTIANIPLPKYVVSRFFPDVKGTFLLSPNEIRELLSVPRRYAGVINQRGQSINLSFSDDDLHSFSVKFVNLYDLYWKSVYPSFELFKAEYPSLYVSFLSRYRSYLLRLTYERVLPVTGLSDFYENVIDIFPRYDVKKDSQGNVFRVPLSPPVLSDLSLNIDYQFNPNCRKDIIEKTNKFDVLYRKMDKSRRITNSILSSQGEYV